MIYCKLERDPVVDVKGQTIDLINNEYHVLLAMGSDLKPAGVGYHDIGRDVSGQKRKLSMAIALCGDSKIIIMDEPTYSEYLLFLGGKQHGGKKI